MRIVKRALANLRYRKLQTIGIVFIFTMLFGVMLICLIVYQATDSTIMLAEKAIANAVTVQPPVAIGADMKTTSVKIHEQDIPILVKPEYVEEYNSVVQYEGFFKLKEYTEKEKELEEKFKLYPGYYEMELENGNVDEEVLDVTAVQNSAYYEPFSSGSFYLKEGRHFTSKDKALHGVLISSLYAKKKHLKVGDTITLHETIKTRLKFMMESTDKLCDMEVLGIYTSDQEQELEEAEDRIYMPYDTFVAYWRDAYNGESRPTVHEITKLIVYLKDTSYIDTYMKYLHEVADIQQVSNVTEGVSYHNINEVNAGKYNTSDPDELTKMFTDTVLGLFQYHQWYYVLIDRNWFDMVAAPILGIRKIVEFVGIALGINTVLILILVCAFSLRRRTREFGVLISLGENKASIVMQMLTETMLMLILAAAIGTAVAPALTLKYGNKLISAQSGYVNLSYEGQKEEYEKKIYGGARVFATKGDDSSKLTSLSNVSAKSHLDFSFDSNTALRYFAVALVIIGISMLLQVNFIVRSSPADLIRK